MFNWFHIINDSSVDFLLISILLWAYDMWWIVSIVIGIPSPQSRNPKPFLMIHSTERASIRDYYNSPQIDPFFLSLCTHKQKNMS